MKLLTLNTFRATGLVTAEDIVEAAKEILVQQFQATKFTIDSVPLAKQLAQCELVQATVECFYVMFLDNQHRLLSFECLFQGTINQSMIYPREIAKRAFELNATAIILVHNHPSGREEPSAADEHLTQTIQSAFKLLEITVIDHLIVAGDQVYSFAEHGQL